MYHLHSIVQRSLLLYTANLNLNVKVLDLVQFGGPIRTRNPLPNTPEFEKASGNAIKT